MNKFNLAFMLVIFSNAVFASELEEFFKLAKTKDCDRVSSFIESSSDSDYLIALSHEYAICNGKDSLEALKHYRKSALKGNTESMYSFFVTVGQLGDAKKQTDELMKEATSWLVKAADLKHYGAATALSSFYKYGGFGFPKDEEKSKYYENISKLKSPNK